MTHEEIKQQRRAVLAEAPTWATPRTPYHHGACIKGAGVSCSLFMAALFNAAIDAKIEVIEHAEQWYLNTNEQLYLKQLAAQGFVKIPKDEAQAADIVVTTTPQSMAIYAHGALLLTWPQPKKIIHCTSDGVLITPHLYSSWYFSHQPDAHKFFCWGGWR